MVSIRDIKRTARGSLHQAMSVPTFYIAVPTATPVSVAVRIWRAREDPAMGETPGQNTGAQMILSENRIRFHLTDALPVLRRLAVVSVEAGEAYRIDHLYPVDGEYQTARVVVLPASEAAGLPVPE